MRKFFLLCVIFAMACSVNLFAFTDTNSNGIMGSWEQMYNINNPNADIDNDSLTNLQEFLRQSNPLAKDEIGFPLAEVGGVNTDGQTYDIEYNDKYLFIADGNKGLKMYDKTTLELVADNASINASIIAYVINVWLPELGSNQRQTD